MPPTPARSLTPNQETYHGSGSQACGQFPYPTRPLSRSRGGIHDLLDFESARSVAEHLSEVHEAIQDGAGVSGPPPRDG
ncbi:hypothetical protein ACWC0A_33815 [Streptomyces scopuliridis]